MQRRGQLVWKPYTTCKLHVFGLKQEQLRQLSFFQWLYEYYWWSGLKITLPDMTRSRRLIYGMLPTNGWSKWRETENLSNSTAPFTQPHTTVWWISILAAITPCHKIMHILIYHGWASWWYHLICLHGSVKQRGDLIGDITSILY